MWMMTWQALSARPYLLVPLLLAAGQAADATVALRNAGRHDEAFTVACTAGDGAFDVPPPTPPVALLVEARGLLRITTLTARRDSRTVRVNAHTDAPGSVGHHESRPHVRMSNYPARSAVLGCSSIGLSSSGRPSSSYSQ